jgi:hypothetical protein
MQSQVAEITRDGIAVVVNVFEVVGVKCPHFGCNCVIDDAKIHKIVDADTWNKFDEFALEQSVEQMRMVGEFQPCPLGCGYFTQEDCLCVNPDCRKKQMSVRYREEVRRQRAEADGLLALGNLATKNPELFRLCPVCYVTVEKNGGCDHMYCSRCKTSFLWSKALPFKSSYNTLYQNKHGKVMKKLD